MIRMLRLLRVLKLKKFITTFYDAVLQYAEWVQLVLQIVKLNTFILFLVHYVGCFNTQSGCSSCCKSSSSTLSYCSWSITSGASIRRVGAARAANRQAQHFHIVPGPLRRVLQYAEWVQLVLQIVKLNTFIL